MRCATSEARLSRSRTRNLGLALLAVALGAAPVAQARSLHVAPGGGAPDSATHALELRLDDSAQVPPADAYVAIGPEQGLANETAIELLVSLDLSRLVVPADAARLGAFAFLHLARNLKAGAASLTLFLAPMPGGGLALGAWTWDDSQARYVLAGQAPLGTGRDLAGVRVALEWSAALESAGRAQGSLRLSRFDDHGQRTVLFERADLDNAGQRVSHVQLGVRAADPGPGITGTLGFDDVMVYRHTTGATLADAAAR